jgi:hypothetical protein
MKKINYNKIWEDDIPEWDKEQLWSRIENNLENKKDRPFFLLMLFAIFFITFVSGTIWFYNRKINETIPKFANNVLKNSEETSSGNFTNINKNTTPKYENNYAIKYLNNKSTRKKHHKNTEIKQITFDSGINISEYIDKIYYIESGSKDLIDSVSFTKNMVLYEILQLPINPKYLYIETRKNLNNTAYIFNAPFKKEIINKKTSFITANTGIGIVLNRTKFDNNSVWQSRKYNNEKLIYDYSLTFQYGKSVFNNFFISSGIDYQNKIVNLVDKDSIVNTVNFQSDSSYFVNLVEPLYFSGKKTKTNIKYRKLNVFNEISHISFPIYFSYLFMNQKYGFTLSYGVFYRFYSKFKGYSISSENKIVKFEDYQNYLKKYSGITDISFSGYYWIKLNRNFNLTLGLETVFPIKPSYSLVSNDAIQFDDKSIRLKSQLGLTYLFR